MTPEDEIKMWVLNSQGQGKEWPLVETWGPGKMCVRWCEASILICLYRQVSWGLELGSHEGHTASDWHGHIWSWSSVWMRRNQFLKMVWSSRPTLLESTFSTIDQRQRGQPVAIARDSGKCSERPLMKELEDSLIALPVLTRSSLQALKVKTKNGLSWMMSWTLWTESPHFASFPFEIQYFP